MESLFDTIAGLPVHPLVVHFAVVLLPLATAGVIASILLPKLRSRYLGLSVVGVLLGTGAAFVAKQSGEALAARVGLPARHADLGSNLVIASVLFFLMSALWFWRNKKASLEAKTPLGLLTSVVGLVVIGLAVITGHTGAEAVWQGKLNPKASSDTSSASSSSGSSTGDITLAQVATHNSSKDCWSAINGKVYNLTDWIDRHPGGPQVIKGLCGKDGSAGFNGQHSGQARPADELKNFYVGTLKK